MIKRILSFSGFIGFLFIFTFSSHASSNPIFGPNKYTRTTGPPNNYTDTFQACNAGAIYSLIIENGESGKDRISSGTVTLNNKEIVKQNEFNQQVDKIQKTISLQKENTVNIKLASGQNGFIKISIYCNTGCLNVQITSPTNASTINKSKTIIKGNLLNAYGETGVIIQSSGVSGQVSGLAQTQKTEFAGIIPLQTGTNTITAQATDACGYKATDTITINTETLQENIRLTAIPNSGIPILNATLEAETNIQNPVSNYSWDINGDGTIEYSGTDSKVQGQYQSTGLYFPSVTVTDTKGNTYTETTIVNVLSKEEMDGLLKGKWTSMKDALISGDIKKALNNFVGGQNSKYKQVFETIEDQLPLIFSAEEELNLVSVHENQFEYENLVVEDGKAYSYPVIFIRDENGLWKILQF